MKLDPWEQSALILASHLVMRVEVSGRQFNFPSQCVCCGGEADRTLPVAASKSTGKRVIHTKTHAWEFPYCSICLQHVSAGRAASSMSVLLAMGATILGIVLFFTVVSWLGIAVALVGVGGAITAYSNLMKKAQRMCGAQCTCVLEAVAFIEWDGARQVFEIGSTQYAAGFMANNERKLVNLSPQALHLLESITKRDHKGGQQVARKYET